MKENIKLGMLTTAVLVFAATVVGGEAKPKPLTQHIDITASRFSFEPHEITVKKGDPVTITLHSTDVTHGLVVENLGIRTEVKKGQTEDVTITPEEAGTFEGKCAHFCGKGHGSMVFTVHVVE
jgi:cytochrome c oxidase subunit II